MDDRELIERLLEQNDRLIAALVGSSPVEIVRALNPPAPAQEAPRDPWGADTPHAVPEDPWGDPRVPSAQAINGWTDLPFAPTSEPPIEEPADATAAAPE